MQLLTKAADRLLSTVVPHVTAAGCIVCPPPWTAECYCRNHHIYTKVCSRTGCECQTVECGPCVERGISC